MPKYLLTLLTACSALALTHSASFGAPATAEQAATIKAAFEKYVGAGAGTNSSPVVVTPNGEHYGVDLDIKKLLRGLEPLGFVFDPLTAHLDLMPQDGGLWHVTNGGTSRFGAKFGEGTVNVIMNGTNFDGLYDPSIPAFTHSKTSYDSITIAGTGLNGATRTRDVQKGSLTFNADVASDGVINVRTAQSSAGSSEDATVDPSTAGAPATHFGLKSGPTIEDAHIDELRIRAAMDLWAFLVAHPSATAIKASQEELRPLLRQLLPLFRHWSQGISVEQTAVESPLGAFAAQSASIRIDANGLVADGTIGSDVKLNALSIPAGLVPGWAEGLVPTSVSLSETLSGFHLDGVAQHAINSFDLQTKEPFTPEATEKFKTLIGPLDQMMLSFAPSRIISRLLDVRIEGRARLQQPIPELNMKVAISGLDKAMQEIQSKAGGDEHVGQVIAAVAFAKGFGKAQPDGSMTWDVTSDPGGGIMVNGIALPFGKGN